MMYNTPQDISFPMVTMFITPTVFSLNGLWSLRGHFREYHKESTHFEDTQDPASQTDFPSS